MLQRLSLQRNGLRYLEKCSYHSLSKMLPHSSIFHEKKNIQSPSIPLFRLDQTRHMGRNDGHSAFYKTRPPTRKQRKKYYKRKREEYHEKVGKHSKPGSRAGPLREYEEIERQDLVDKGSGKISRGLLPENMGYNYGDGEFIYIFLQCSTELQLHD